VLLRKIKVDGVNAQERELRTKKKKNEEEIYVHFKQKRSGEKKKGASKKGP